jgi:Leucine-rich repeat (LRR) protein
MRLPGMRFSVRSLMIAIALLCPVLAAIAPLVRSPEFRELKLSMGWGTENEQEAITGIERMRGTIRRDRASADRPVISVRLEGIWVSNPGLVHVRAFNRLESLVVRGADVYDSGLAQLRGSRKLRSLTLSNTWITDSGLGHLENLTGLETLDLSLNRGVTDAGLRHLEGLTQLRVLDLSDTGVTESGIQNLRSSLPNTKIVR